MSVRGSNLEKGESEGLPGWSRHAGDPVLAGNCLAHGSHGFKGSNGSNEQA
ncbi:hypothetical protein [Streptomyces sp. NPDC127072]|uniref:hypothetical protein n=1 Tax=Streptomyces sp. NPDC127072 TaxID=3347129 RepID=UPI00364F31AD